MFYLNLYWINFQKIYIYKKNISKKTYKKTLLFILLWFVFKIVETLQCILNLMFYLNMTNIKKKRNTIEVWKISILVLFSALYQITFFSVFFILLKYTRWDGTQLHIRWDFCYVSQISVLIRFCVIEFRQHFKDVFRMSKCNADVEYTASRSLALEIMKKQNKKILILSFREDICV